MTGPIVLAGPASASALSEWLDSEDGRRARELPGISGTALTNIAEAFLRAGHHVELVTLAPELKGGEVVTLEGRRLRLLIAPLRARVRHHCRDAFRQERRHVRALLSTTSGRVVNAHWGYEFALAAIGLPGRLTIVTTHDSPFTVLRHQRPRRYPALRAAMAVGVRLQGPALTTVSPHLATAWRRQMLYRREIPVIPNAVPIINTNRSEADELLSPTILDVADFGKLKNVETLIRAMPEILDSCPGAKLRLVGHGLTEQSSLAGLARRLGLDQQVEFIGYVGAAELNSIYRQADVFVHASLEEACSMTISEAMSHELPIVAGMRSGGVPWLLDEGRVGLLVDVRNPTAIANGVTKLLADPGLRRRLAAAAQAHVRSHHSPEVVSAAYLEVYARAAASA